jgi:hypothetical protein
VTLSIAGQCYREHILSIAGQCYRSLGAQVRAARASLGWSCSRRGTTPPLIDEFSTNLCSRKSRMVMRLSSLNVPRQPCRHVYIYMCVYIYIYMYMYIYIRYIYIYIHTYIHILHIYIYIYIRYISIYIRIHMYFTYIYIHLYIYICSIDMYNIRDLSSKKAL